MNTDTTAMQELLKWAKNDGEMRHTLSAKTMIAKAIELLSKEKEQILDAFVAGDERGTKDIPFNAEQYYNQTYNN